MTVLDVSILTQRLRTFAEDRAWGPFHTPKNLAMALAGEAGEVIAELQWLSDKEIAEMLAADGEGKQALADELADVMIYLTRLADVAGIDLAAAVSSKLFTNESRFPAR